MTTTPLINGQFSEAQLMTGISALRSDAVAQGAISPRKAFCEAAGLDANSARLPDFVLEAIANAEPKARERRAYGQAIAALPEAVDRPKAAARIAQIHNAQSLPLHRASALLASLPSEAEAREAEAQATQAKQAQAEMNGPQNLKRRVELRISALSLKADKGDEGARSEQRKLEYAMRIVAQSPSTPLSTALTLAGANVAAIR